MRSVQVSKPGARQVRTKVQACGICHSDSVTKDGSLPHIKYPKAPAHEVAGIRDKVGSEVPNGRPDSESVWVGIN